MAFTLFIFSTDFSERVGERERSMGDTSIGCLLHRPWAGPGIEPAPEARDLGQNRTPDSSVHWPNHWAKSARAGFYFILKEAEMKNGDIYLFWKVNYELIILYFLLYKFVIYSGYVYSGACSIFFALWFQFMKRLPLSPFTYPHPRSSRNMRGQAHEQERAQRKRPH